ncbi:MAG TPA: carboxylating nicotinate-nucleotide diphosphorylase [Syntrophomonadaceae bacterium]|jgi:nicotinate-nucleotide pyrophosphorylase (carboxylating)|nr:carboxylating nicotinate-nucleotide diphosphorylase [Syntrophomonadaceae bacterium]
MIYPGLESLIKRALEEDIGYGDITTQSLIPAGQISRGLFIAKSPGVVAGIQVSEAVFRQLDSEITFEVFKNDGEVVLPREVIAVVQGQTRALLTGERTALNFLQRLSGIATKTRRVVELIKDSKAQLVDTRKTTPGLRVLEKYAVSIGGARNHRFGLFDGVMIKDNHIQAVGNIREAVAMARQKVPHTVKIEVEVENLAQLREAVDAGADIIMLDNMGVEEMAEAVSIVEARALLEASGGINESNIVEVARTGIDFISMGALTHSATSLDISLDLVDAD